MRIAFYAPMKSPQHPRPSGDRRIGRLLIDALERAGCEVEVASHLRTWEGRGDPLRQRELRDTGHAEAERLLRHYRNLPPGEQPQVWFTYHLYHKAPDWIGPKVATALSIPYIVAEASHAPKQEGGAWDRGYRSVEAALQRADAVISLNPVDLMALRSLPGMEARLHRISPFIDLAQLEQQIKGVDRKAIARCYSLDPDIEWIMAVGMMRNDAKLASYRLLARAAAELKTTPWQLLLVGDGPAEDKVRRAFAHFDDGRVVFTGLLRSRPLHRLMAAVDLFLWPAINEAFGMAILEAQGCGLPVVAGASGGVCGIVEDRVSGLLVPPNDPLALAQAADLLLGNNAMRNSMALAAREKVRAAHGIVAASAALKKIICRLLPYSSLPDRKTSSADSQ